MWPIPQETCENIESKGLSTKTLIKVNQELVQNLFLSLSPPDNSAEKPFKSKGLKIILEGWDFNVNNSATLSITSCSRFVLGYRFQSRTSSEGLLYVQFTSCVYGTQEGLNWEQHYYNLKPSCGH